MADRAETTFDEALREQVSLRAVNARLVVAEQQRAARIVTIARVGQLITSQLSLDQLLTTAVAAIRDSFSYADVVLMLVDPDDPAWLVLRACGGIFAQTGDRRIGAFRQRIDQGVVGEAVQTRRPVLVADVRTDPRFLSCPGDEDIQAELAVPLVVGDELLGVLNIESAWPIEVEDAESLIIVADQLGIAIHNASLFAELQQALDETRLLYATSQRLGLAMEVDDVIAVYLDQVAAGHRYECLVVLDEVDQTGERCGIKVWGRWRPGEGLAERMSERLPDVGDAFAPPLDAGQTVTIEDVAADRRVTPALRNRWRDAGWAALALIPLMARGQRIGLVVLSTTQPRPWRAADLRPYVATAAQLAAAIDGRQQRGLWFERGQQLAVLEERQRLARELHDSVTQLIFSTTLIAQSIGPAWRRDPAEGERRAARLLELSRSALAEMRALLFELRPAEPDQAASATSPSIAPVHREGLVPALERHLAGLRRDGLPVTLTADGYAPQVVEHEEALFRIAQEALNNAVKHARAGQVMVALAVEGDRARLAVADDGVGFAPGAGPGGFGLRTMRGRAGAVGGAVEVRSAPGCGTTVMALLPARPAGAR